MTQDKSLILNSILRELGSYVIAFSGGVDSSFLLHRSHSLNSSSVMAVTIRTPYIPSREINEAIDFCNTHGIMHTVVDLPFPELIRNNSVDRCYLCKKTLFSQLLKFARDNHFRYVVDGSNADDPGEYRPGMKALKELGIRSPLLEAGLTKNEIRELSKNEGLEFWDKPALSCLLTRIPYETEITEGILRMIEKAESMFCDKGYPGVRIRAHGDIARIECLPGYMDRIITGPDRDYIISHLKKLGFRYITIDLEGYRTGSNNPA
jgi:uncharacterized protein